MNVLEVGSSHQLDYIESSYWDKMVHYKLPNYYHNLFYFNEIPEICGVRLEDYDVIIFSLSAFDETRFDPNSYLDDRDHKFNRMMNCLETTMKYMSYFCCKANSGTRFILMGSICANDLHTYKTRPYYAMLKSAQRSFFKNMAINNPDKRFLEIAFDHIEERVAIQTISNYINRGYFNNQYEIIQNNGINIGDPDAI